MFKSRTSEPIYDQRGAAWAANRDTNTQIHKRRGVLNDACTWHQAVTARSIRGNLESDAVTASLPPRHHFLKRRTQRTHTVPHLRFATAITREGVMLVTGTVDDEECAERRLRLAANGKPERRCR